MGDEWRNGEGVEGKSSKEDNVRESRVSHEKSVKLLKNNKKLYEEPMSLVFCS